MYASIAAFGDGGDGGGGVTGAALGGGLEMSVLADSVAVVFVFVSPSFIAFLAFVAWLFVVVFMVWSPSFVTCLVFVAWFFVVVFIVWSPSFVMWASVASWLLLIFFAVVMALSVRGRAWLRFVPTPHECLNVSRPAVASGVVSEHRFLASALR